MTMKKFMTNIKTFAALLLVGAVLGACSGADNLVDDNIIDNNQQSANPAKQKYTLTIAASKSNDKTSNRALSLDGKTLNASWAEGEEVTVYNVTKRALLEGTLSAQSSVPSTTLSGSLTGIIENGDNLELQFPRATWDYTGQTGVLTGENSIEKKYDYALANVTVASVDGSGNVTPTADASFANQQAIVKFMLKDKSGNPINASSLNISANSGKLVTAKGPNNAVKTYPSGYKKDDVNISFCYSSCLFDGNTNTQGWCDNTTGWCEFHTTSAFQVDGYTLTTGLESESNTDCNPKNWVLKAKLNSGDAWTTIATITNDATMQDISQTPYDFNVDVPGEYQYFRFEVSATLGANKFQLSELQLFKNTVTRSTSYDDLAITPASGTASEFYVALRNENDGADTYTLTANVGGDDYVYTKGDVTFQNGKYYGITVKMAKYDPLAVPLTIEALNNGNILISNPKSGMKYSKNSGAKTDITTSISVSAGDKVQFYGNGTSITSYDGTKIQGNEGFQCKAFGNIMSLVDEENFATATTLSSDFSFNELFEYNYALTDASDLLLPATTLSGNCYNSMFYYCANMTKAPVLPATKLVYRCYRNMFRGCSSLSSLTCLATTGLDADRCTEAWLSGVAGPGSFTTADGVDWPEGVSGIPGSWKRLMPDGTRYFTPNLMSLTMEALTDGNIKIQIGPDGLEELPTAMYYTKNGGYWNAVTTTTTIEVNAGDIVNFYGNGTSLIDYGKVLLRGTAQTMVYGNVMSLLDENNFPTATTIPSGGSLGSLFDENTNLIDASNLVLPATTLRMDCYWGMFWGCTSLTTAPVLPATNLVSTCYENMFKGCSSLNSVTCMATSNTGYGTPNWLDGVAATGTFNAASGASWPEGASGIPSGWTRVDK